MTHYVIHHNNDNPQLNIAAGSHSSMSTSGDYYEYEDGSAATIIGDGSDGNGRLISTTEIADTSELGGDVVEEEGILYAYQDENGTNSSVYIISEIMDEETGQMINVAIPIDPSTLTSSIETIGDVNHSYQSLVVQEQQVDAEILDHTREQPPSFQVLNMDDTASLEENNEDYDENEETTEITVQEEGDDSDDGNNEPSTTTEFQLVQQGNYIIVRNSEGTIVNQFSLPTSSSIDSSESEPKSHQAGSSTVHEIPLQQYQYHLQQPHKVEHQLQNAQRPRPAAKRKHKIDNHMNSSSRKYSKIQPAMQLQKSEAMNIEVNSNCRLNNPTSDSDPLQEGDARTSSKVLKSRIRGRNKFNPKNCKIIIKCEGSEPNTTTNYPVHIVPLVNGMKKMKSCVGKSYNNTGKSKSCSQGFRHPQIRETLEVVKSESESENVDKMGLPFGYSGQSFNIQAQKLILNVYDFFRKTNKSTSYALNCIGNPQEKAARVLNVSSSVISRINKSFTTGNLEAPNKKDGFKRVLDLIDDHDEEVIKSIIQDFGRKGITPTVPILLQEARERIGFIGSRTSFRRVLQKMGFKYAKINKKTVILSIKKSGVAASPPPIITTTIRPPPFESSTPRVIVTSIPAVSTVKPVNINQTKIEPKSETVKIAEPKIFIEQAMDVSSQIT